VVVGLAVAWIVGNNSDVAAVGEEAPDFTVALLDGGSFNLSQHLVEDGRPLVLNLWASWCLPCRDEIPDLSAFANTHPDIAVLGVAVRDALPDSQAFAEAISPSYPVAFGDKAFSNAYPNYFLPSTYYIDSDGTVSSIVNGIVDQESLEELTG